jgi:hypothetical protein
MTVFAFAYDDVFSIVKRPYATREPMSSEDEQIWQKNEEKIIEFVREFHEEVLEAEEKLSRTKAETLVVKAHSSAICCAFGRKRNDDEEYLLAVAIISTDCATVGIVESVMVNCERVRERSFVRRERETIRGAIRVRKVVQRGPHLRRRREGEIRRRDVVRAVRF